MHTSFNQGTAHVKHGGQDHLVGASRRGSNIVDVLLRTMLVLLKTKLLLLLLLLLLCMLQPALAIVVLRLLYRACPEGTAVRKTQAATTLKTREHDATTAQDGGVSVFISIPFHISGLWFAWVR